MNNINPKVDIALGRAKKWKAEMLKLRAIMLDCQLSEELKWYQPCYSYLNSNVVIIGAFKDYCALLFFKGALLSDSQGLLVKPGENTQAGRQMRFSSEQQIAEMEPIIRAYVFEAIEVEKAGLKVNLKPTAEYSIPEEFGSKLDEMPSLKAAFEALTPGRQRYYLLHFAGAKQTKTRQARIEKCIPDILAGKGLNER